MKYLFDASFDVSPLPNAVSTPDNASPASASSTTSTPNPANPPSLWRGKLSRGWTGGNNRPIGSVVYCTALKCALQYGQQLGYPDPVAFQVNFLTGPPGGAEVIIEIKEKKRGGNYLFLNAELRLAEEQEEGLLHVTTPGGGNGTRRAVSQLIMTCSFTLGTLPEAEEGFHMLAPRYLCPPVSLPPPEHCVEPYTQLGAEGLFNPPRAEAEYGLATMSNTICVGADPAAVRSIILEAERRRDAGELSAMDLSEGPCWVYFSDGRPHDCLSAAFFADMNPCNLVLQNIIDAKNTFWLPSSLSFQMNFFCKPDSKLLKRVMIAGVKTGKGSTGLADFEIALWDEEGKKLVAISRQAAHMTQTSLEYRDQVMGRAKI